MILPRTFLAIAAFALTPLISAQGTKIQFTQIPGPATIGQPSTIKWTGGDGSPVTLLLLEGELSSPKTLGILASNVDSDSYTWTPGSALPPADDYLLEITQGVQGVGFSGQFTLQNATAAQATTIYAVAGSSTIAISTVLPNSTAAATAGVNATSTSTVVLQSSITAASASGTGVTVPRNTTFVSQSLTPTGTATTTATAVSTTTTASTGTSAGGAVARATQGMLGFGALAAAAVYLL